MSGGVFVFLEWDQAAHRLHPLAAQLIGGAQQLTASSGAQICAAVIGKHPEHAQPLLEGFALDKVFLCSEPDAYFRVDRCANHLQQCIKQCLPDVVLMGGTACGRAIASRIAVHFGTGVTADCTELLMQKDALIQVRPAFGGDVLARIVTPHSRPQIATVRQNVLPEADTNSTRSIHFIQMPALAQRAAVDVLHLQKLPPKRGISEARVLIAVGCGLQKSEDLALIESMAELLHAEIACTRGIIERGWLSPERQIGLSGQTVRPSLLIACGVSGSVQFQAGMQGAQRVIAINTDPNARIFEFAHESFCGDLYELLPNTIEILSQSRNTEGFSVP